MQFEAEVEVGGLPRSQPMGYEETCNSTVCLHAVSPLKYGFYGRKMERVNTV